MSVRPLVSVIVPCYNVEKTVARALNSVYKQTYRPIELIIVNDGSTDNTEAVINKETANYGESDITVKYINQKNRGLGGAIDTGLKHFTGEYLAWFDSDDELMPTSVEKRVDFLQNNPSFACVTSDAYVVDGKDWDTSISLISQSVKDNEKEDQFELLLKNQSVFCSGCHMVRGSVFNMVNPTKSIYPSRAGQNWQLLLPVYYKNKRAFLAEPLYKYGAYTESMSAQIKKMPFDKRISREYEYIRIVENTLNSIERMEKKERMRYIKRFKANTYRRILDISVESKEKFVYFKHMIKLIPLKALKMAEIKCFIKLWLK
ncbi:MAG: glycosyltransferase family 2 protein [Clostridia bacterium]|nr:glycosyltransferase family 2 protein [Clostridia bacterium]